MQASLAEYVTAEEMVGDNQWAPKEGVKVDALKGVRFRALPPLLMLHLKRFVFNFQRMAREKARENHAHHAPTPRRARPRAPAPSCSHASARRLLAPSPVRRPDRRASLPASLPASKPLPARWAPSPGPSPPLHHGRRRAAQVHDALAFPEVLDMRPYIDVPDGGEGGRGGEAAAKPPTQPLQYELFAVMIHHGTAMGGHYFAYIKACASAAARAATDGEKLLS